MEKPKRISVKIDETIDNFLSFIYRYFATLFIICKSPFSPEIILNSLDSEPPRYVKPLTFLAIGAFSFSLIIAVFPVGLHGLAYMIYDISEIKAQIRANWKQAISVTSLLISGMPTIFAVVALAKISGKFFFKDYQRKQRWFEINCYVFGFQTVFFLFLFTLDSLLESVAVILPLVKEIPISDDLLSYFLITFFAITALVTLIWPPLLLSVTFNKLFDHSNSKSHLVRAGAIFILYYPLCLFFYPGVASILPSLEGKYFPKAEITVQLHDFKPELYLQHMDTFRFVVGFEIENPTTKDSTYILESTDFSFEWGVSEQEFHDGWDLQSAKAVLIEPASIANRFIVQKQSTKNFVARIESTELKEIFCEAVNLEIEQDKLRLNSNSSSLNTFNLVFELGGSESTLLVDIEDFFGVEFDEFERMSVICNGDFNSV